MTWYQCSGDPDKNFHGVGIDQLSKTLVINPKEPGRYGQLNTRGGLNQPILGNVV